LATLATSLSLLTLREGFAAPPDFAQVPADVDWLFHVDADALRKATAFQQIVKTTVARWKSVTIQLDKLNRQYGMDLARDLHGMTVFAPQLSQRKTVLILRADWPLETFRERLALAPDHTVAVDGSYEIHRFTQKARGQARPVVTVPWKQGTFVFGQGLDEVKFSLDVLDGKRRGLSGAAAPSTADVPAGTIVVARMMRVGDRLPVESPLLKQTEQIDFVCGEDAGEWFVHVKLQTKSSEAAQQAKQVAEGLLAMVRLRLAGNTDAIKLLDRAELKIDRNTISLDFHAPAADVARNVEMAMENFSEHNGRQ
jgi:hypothetical protein